MWSSPSLSLALMMAAGCAIGPSPKAINQADAPVNIGHSLAGHYTLSVEVWAESEAQAQLTNAAEKTCKGPYSEIDRRRIIITCNDAPSKYCPLGGLSIDIQCESGDL